MFVWTISTIKRAVLFFSHTDNQTSKYKTLAQPTSQFEISLKSNSSLKL